MSALYSGPYELTFTKLNMRQSMKIYWAVMHVAFCIFIFLIPGFDIRNEGSWIQLIAIFISAMFWFGFGLMVRIKIDDTGVCWKGVFFRRQLLWSEIADHGVIQKNRYDNKRLSLREPSKRDLLSNRYEFVSTEQAYKPYGFDFILSGKAVILFDYRREAYELIKYYLGKYQPVRPLE